MLADMKVDALGRTLSISLELDEAKVRPHEPIYASFMVRLDSGDPLILIEGGDYRNHLGRPESYAVAAIDADGHALPTRDAGPQMGGVMGGRRLSVDKPFRRRLLLSLWVRFERVGPHRIVVDKLLRFAREPWSAESLRAPGAEMAVRVEAMLEVQPPSTEALGDVIDALGHRATSNDADADEAERALASIHDERVIPHYVRMLRNGGARSFVALNRLGGHGTEEAFRAVAEALAKPEYRSYEDVRALGTNAHPQALELLWSFRHDEAENIRLAVLQGVFFRRAPNCADRMRTFLDDPDSGVREEAKHLLEELGR
jgi:hypothetical protein